MSQRIAIVRHVRVDDQHVVVFLERQVLSGRQSETWGDDSLDRRVVGEVDEQHSVFQSTRALQIGTEEVVFFSRDTHGAEHHNELFIGILEFGLSSDLQSDVVVGQTRCRENGQFLPTYQRRAAVDSGNTRLDEIVRRLSAVRVDGRTDDVGLFVSNDFRSTITGATCTIENATNKVGAHREFEHVTHEGDTRVSVDFGRAFKHLNNHEIVRGVKHLSILDFTVGETEGYDFTKRYGFGLVQKDQRAFHVGNGSVFFSCHLLPLLSWPPRRRRFVRSSP